MNSPLHKLNHNGSLVAKLAANLIVSSALLLTASVSMAEETAEKAAQEKAKKTDIAYVDSVHHWGAWGLDIEPAAGGLQQASTQALNARNSKVALRTNSIAALSPAIPAIPATPAVPAMPTAPVPAPSAPAIPATPAIPTVSNISHNVPVPTGAP